jgi:eukaryotic-like serine/threonine-protein kinase
MTTIDAASVAQIVRQTGLVTDEQLRDCWDELDSGVHDPAMLLKLLERKGYITPWHSSKVLKGDTDGYFLGGYRVLYKIASGSFGRVFRAEDPRSGTVVAVKVLRRRWTEDPHKVELFKREGQMGMQMHHPNIVSILNVATDRPTGQHFLVMEFIEGGNLRDFLGIRKKLEPKEAVRLLEECSAALAYAYSRNMTHRDLKLTNVLISTQGSAKLVDFGLAELAAAGPGEDRDIEVDRTVDYAGLERATGSKRGDVRSDIFFMGCIFYEMLSGHAPLVHTRDHVARMHRHRFENIPPIFSYGVELPQPVQFLLDRMIAFDPAARYQTPTQLHEAVRRVQGELEGAPTARMTPTGPRSVFIVEKHPKLQDAMREKFSADGFRVLISQDPDRAVHRYEEQPFHAMIVDVGTAGEAGIRAFNRIVEEADSLDLTMAGVVILSEDQADWAGMVKDHPGVAVLIRPINMKNLSDKLFEMMGQGQEAEA